MTDSENREKNRARVAEFRYSIVAELANPYLDHGKLNDLIREKAKRNYQIPGSMKTSVTEACIRKWLSSYRKFGKDGLLPKERADLGKSRAIDEHEENLFVEYLAEHPNLTATAAFKKLLKEGKIRTDLTKSTLSRIVTSHRLSKQERVREAEKEKNLKFEFFYPLECVQADCLHGPEITLENGKKKKAILIAFIDDATRKIVYSEFSDTEQSLVFEKGLKHILGSCGRIGRAYVDNGSTFVSNQTRRILDILQITLVHSRPYKPAGRGKIERFFRTVRDSFLRPLDVSKINSFGQMNSLFRTWVETEYHRSPHRGLTKKTPLEVWMEKAHHIVPLEAGTDLDRIFLHEDSRKVYKDSTLTLKGTLYEVPQALIGRSVRLYYDPQQPHRKVTVSCDGVDYGECRQVDTYANTKVFRNTSRKDEVAQSESTVMKNIGAALAASRSFSQGGGK